MDVYAFLENVLPVTANPLGTACLCKLLCTDYPLLNVNLPTKFERMEVFTDHFSQHVELQTKF